MANEQFTLTVANVKSIAIGAVLNLSGTSLLAIGLFLQGGAFSTTDFQALGLALLANLGTVIVNTVRKYISVE